MNTFVELHALRSFPPSNLNRDDLGTPKTAIFGGARRLRISSQCLKRTWRTSEHFRGTFAEDQLGVRTARLPEETSLALDPGLDELARGGLIALLELIGKKGGKPAGKKGGTTAGTDDDADESSDDVSTGSPEAGADRLRRHLLFLSRQEMESVAAFARANEEKLKRVFNKKKADAQAIKNLRNQLRDHLESTTSKNAVDIALFGRFITSDEFDTVDGALQVAHGLGTQKVEVEYDYFTAVDDLGDGPGAGHLGESEYASSVFYLYACCDLAQLQQNLGARSSSGRVVDPEAVALARKSIPALVRAMAEATPKGKKNGTAPHTPAEYVEVIVRRGAPLSFANAFSKPVSPHERQGDVMAASIARFRQHRDRIETAYGRDEDVVARFVLSLRDLDGASTIQGTPVSSIRQLAERLGAALASLPAGEPS